MVFGLSDQDENNALAAQAAPEPSIAWKDEKRDIPAIVPTGRIELQWHHVEALVRQHVRNMMDAGQLAAIADIKIEPKISDKWEDATLEGVNVIITMRPKV